MLQTNFNKMILDQFFISILELCFVVAVVCDYKGPCRLYKNDKFANCSFRDLTSVPKEIYLRAGEIRYLDLSNNRFERIKERAFSQFIKLKTLNLDDNKIAEIDAHAFVGMNALTTLSIQRNLLLVQKTSIPKHLFAPIKNLTHLYLGGNLKNVFTPNDLDVYPDEAFSHLKQLEFLSLDLYPKPEFGIGFRQMKSLKTIKFDRCELIELNNDTFKNLSSSVQSLHMTNCEDIHPNVGKAALEHFVNLKILDLSHSLISLPSAINLLYGLENNSMEEINLFKVNTNRLAGTLCPYSVVLTHENTYHLRQICVKRLNVGFNEIVEVRNGSLFSLNRLDCLEDFVISGNRFDLIYTLHLYDLLQFFENAVNLKSFDFSYMAVEIPNYLYPYTPLKSGRKRVKRWMWNPILVLKCPRHFHTLRLTRTLWYLQDIRNMRFIRCEEFRHLDISYSSIQHLNFNITGIDMTETLDISGIDISKAFPRLLYSVPNLKHLYINDVNLDKLFDQPMGLRLFSILKYIEKIVMTKNHVKNMSSVVFKDLHKLNHINLSENSLEKFPEALLEVESIKTLDLSENKLTTLPEKATKWLDNATRKNGNVAVFLRGNILSCKCENSQFLKWLFSTQIKFDDKRNYSCELEGGVISNTIFVNDHFSDIFVNCESGFWLVFSVVFSVIMVIALILSIIAFRFRWRISYFFHRYFKQDTEYIDASEYIYHAFVAYPADDYQWIWKEMRVKMEENYGLKLCLHDREFVPGETISQNIHNFMQKSKKIIFDLTPGFVSAKWFDYELEAAKMDMIDRKNNGGIIVILRNGIQSKQMPRAFSKIWHNITCLSWPDEEDDIATQEEAETMFWKRLRDVLEA